MTAKIRIHGQLVPFTPKMRAALLGLACGEDRWIGRPTKQRLAKYGFAKYTDPNFYRNRDWDGEMRITPLGRRTLERIGAIAPNLQAHPFTGNGPVCAYDWPNGDEKSEPCGLPREAHA